MSQQKELLYLPTQIRFLIGGERVTCHWSKLHDALGRTKLYDALGQQQLELSTCTWSGRALLKPRQICLPAGCKRLQTRSEEEIEQLLHDKSSKSTNKAIDNAVRTLRDFCKERNLDECFQELSKTDLNSLLRKFCNKFVSPRPSMLGVSGKQNTLFPLGPVIKCLLTRM